jgi:FtsH-binding integral membrane protein
MENPSAVATANFAPTFMSKVFFFFGLAIAVSALGAYVGLNYFASYFVATPALTYGLIIVELILIFTSGFWSKKAPLSYILFSAFALCTGLTLVPILAYLTLTAGGVAILIKAFTATALMFGACAIFGHTTHYNLQGMRGFLIMGLFGMIIVSVIGIFVPWSNTFEMVFSGIGVILFSAYTMYDIQKLKHYPENAYIDAAIRLYLDIFNLFLFILRLIMSFDRS